jgi:hypothetical protein
LLVSATAFSRIRFRAGRSDLAHVRRRLLAATTALQTIVRHDEMLSVPVKDYAREALEEIEAL